ncbi:HNH endonuclease signature motif containing protein [Marivita sp.]|uniref:HNH endonuclease n=1 Tax=Marivita sp. TaxID=2003365 RepID=UPI0025B7B34B|nr:HNH endonuclease signature motif containing protein [Marivita sp.]
MAQQVVQTDRCYAALRIGGLTLALGLPGEYVTKKLDPEMPCKPCWELKYCPYGYLVEYSPFPTEDYAVSGRRALYEEAMAALRSGELESEDDVWGEMERVLHLNPAIWEEIEGFAAEDVGCRVFGHVCPVFIHASGATETKGSRSQGRHIPREVMLKVVRRDAHVCQKCHKYVPDDEIEFDHVIPYSKGGPSTVENLRLLCRSCNRKKSNSLEEVLR